MPQSIVIIGAGFAGVWSALSAKRLLNLNKDDTKILIIAPQPTLVIRPRLYEANVIDMVQDLTSLFDSVGIEFVQGKAETIDTVAQSIRVRAAHGAEAVVRYDRLILAAGSAVNRPQSVAGLQQHGFDVDNLNSASSLERHLKSLSSLPPTSARNTIVVCGAGFTGIELAAELPKRLSHISDLHVILVESADDVGPELGPGPRPTITQALQDLHVEVKLGCAVSEVDAGGVTLMTGERIDAKTVIWTAGMRATSLTRLIPGPKDALGRIHVNQHLGAAEAEHVFATGDAAYALADTQGHYALMSCQHALQLGRVSGHNAAADILEKPMIEYSQAGYNCCLDLGSWGAVICGGWDREVKLAGDSAKRVKEYINRTLIYPPRNAEEALIVADPVGLDSDQLFEHMLKVVG